MNEAQQAAVDKFKDKGWRLNNLYTITDKHGKSVPFRMNWGQQQLFDNMTHLSIILKCRQVGFSTFIQLYMLDECIFHPDVRAGVIAHSLEDAQAIFRDKVKYPYDNLPEGLRAANPATTDSARQLSFGNNSSLRVGTSLRSGTFQYLHVSEFGKIAASYPEKAREIKTGAFNTVQAGELIWVESTAEGQEGAFYDMCEVAQEKDRQEVKITPLDFKFHFFPWWKHPEYRLDAGDLVIPSPIERYVDGLAKEHKIHLEDEQVSWYVKKSEVLGSDIKREFPSTAAEAFEASIEGAYYADQMARADGDGRITNVPHDSAVKVEVWHDLGIGDSTVQWYIQRVGKEIHVIDYYENSGESLAHYVNKISDLGKPIEAGGRAFDYEAYVFPHDVKARELIAGKTREETLRSLGISASVIPQHKVEDGIEAVRNMLPRCWFDAGKCSVGIKHLRSYRKDWDEAHGTWKNKPRHDQSSHCFTGETKVLTRSGTHQIMGLPQSGEVLTACGWKAYRNPRITRRNARVVEVAFSDGSMVRCTPDHLFMTAIGWISSEHLQPGMLIQSTLTPLRSISMALSTAYIRVTRTIKAEMGDFTGMFGQLLSAQFQQDVISTTGIMTPQITEYPILSVSPRQSIFPTTGTTRVGQSISRKGPEMLLLSGIGPRRVDFGTVATLKSLKAGQSGSGKLSRVLTAAKNTMLWLEALIHRSFATLTARHVIIESVSPAGYEDVWCLTVPEVEHFSLANGAVVHNCADAFRYGAMFRGRRPRDPSVKTYPDLGKY